MLEVQDATGAPVFYGTAEEQAGFEYAINQNPFEGTNHMAFADWLDDNGQPHEAAFRRVLGQWMGEHDWRDFPGQGETQGFHPRFGARRPSVIVSHTGADPYPWTIMGHYVPHAAGVAGTTALPRELWNIDHWFSDEWNYPLAPAHRRLYPQSPDLQHLRDLTIEQAENRYGAIPLHIARWSANRPHNMSWDSYHSMEEGLRRAFLHGRGRIGGLGKKAEHLARGSAQTTDGGPLEYDEMEEPPATISESNLPIAEPFTPPTSVRPLVPPAPMIPAPVATPPTAEPAGIRRPVPGLPDDPSLRRHLMNIQQEGQIAAGDPRIAIADYLGRLPGGAFKKVLDHFGVSEADSDPMGSVADAVLRSGFGRRKPEMPRPQETFDHEFIDWLANMRAHHPGKDEFGMQFASLFANLEPDLIDKAYKLFGIDPNAGDAPNQLLQTIWRRMESTPVPTKPEPLAETNPHLETPERATLRDVNVTGESSLDDSGVNTSKKLHFEDGTFGVFKPMMGEMIELRKGVPPWTQGRREVAASVLADLLGFGDLVPTTTLRQHDGQEGSVQRFKPGTVAGRLNRHEYRYDGVEDLGRAAVLDYILGNSDRHSGNWLVNNPNTPQSKLVLIDNGLTLPVRNDSHDYRQGNHLFWNQAVLAHNLDMPNMAGMAERWPALEDALTKLNIEPEAIANLKKRFDWVTSGRFRKIGDLPAYFRENPARPNEPLPALRTMLF